jgi:hypothetical protein
MMKNKVMPSAVVDKTLLVVNASAAEKTAAIRYRLCHDRSRTPCQQSGQPATAATSQKAKVKCQKSKVRLPGGAEQRRIVETGVGVELLFYSI